MSNPNGILYSSNNHLVSVLIVDDEEQIGSSICELLSLQGISAVSVDNADACLCYLNEHAEPDIVLLDINLGKEMNGIELLSIIKEQHKYAQVIMFTSMDSLDVAVECMKRGAFDYMLKPFNEEEFMKKIPLALERKRMSRLNDLYLNILVHDLKNPLQYIAGALEFFEQNIPAFRSNENLLRMMQIATSGVRGIRNIIGNILGIARMENGTLVPHLVPFDLRAAVEPVFVSFKTDNKSDDRTWELSYPAEEPCIVHTDRDLFIQVLTNIIANAIRFTPMGGTIAVCFVKPTPAILQTSVSNTGSFIPDSLRSKVFDRFASVYTAAGETLNGQNFGLGLTFSKMAIEALGGTIWVESQANPPLTTFKFTVPSADSCKNHK